MISFLPSAVDECHQASAFGRVKLASAFQPIYSFSHQRLVGHEALLRASGPDGRPIAPPRLFDACADMAERRALDFAARVAHTARFADRCELSQWLFLNVDPSACDPRASGPDLIAPLVESVCSSGLEPHQIVIELLEAALPDELAFERWAYELKAAGFLVALDDFGAGHSNLDRVFRLRPQIIKLDRSVILQAAVDRSIQRVLSQTIALLHECGAQVLVEGVETPDEASLALDSNADFVQGYLFGRPAAEMRRTTDHCAPMAQVWASGDERLSRQAIDRAARIEPYRRALIQAKSLLETGRPMIEACAAFVALECADLCYLLDERGAPVAGSVVHRRPATHVATTASPFAPLLDVSAARWSRRPYFRNAVAAPGRLQVTRPYPTMHSAQMSVTLSVAFELGGRLCVLCGDKIWPADGDAAPEMLPPSVPPAVAARSPERAPRSWTDSSFFPLDTITIG